MAPGNTLSRRNTTLAGSRLQLNKTSAGGDARPSHLVVDSRGFHAPSFLRAPEIPPGGRLAS